MLETNLTPTPFRISGRLATDDRGVLKFINEFNPFERQIKRFYQVENNDVCEIRAWHGHRTESKFCYCVKGSAIIATVPLETNDPEKANITRLIISSQDPSIIYIPPGYYNGFRTLEKGTILQFFSTSTLEESKGDDIRLPYDAFGKEIWEIIPR